MPVVPPSSSAPGVTGLIGIGSVVISHGDPKFSWTAAPTSHGIRSCTISGSCLWLQADALEELVANEDRQTTIAGRTGVLEFIEFGGALLANRTGHYLLEDFKKDAGHEHSLNGVSGDVPFTIIAAYVSPAT